MNAELMFPRDRDKSGKTEPSEQHLQHCLANSHKSEHCAAIFKRRRLYDADRVTRLPDRTDGKLLPQMRRMKSPPSIQHRAAVTSTRCRCALKRLGHPFSSQRPKHDPFIPRLASHQQTLATINWGTCRGESGESPCWESLLGVCPT